MIWSLILAAVGLAGLYLAGKKNYWGWGIGLAAQLLWIVYAVVSEQYGFILSALAYGFVYGKNFVDWGPKIKLGEEVLPIPSTIVINTGGELDKYTMDEITRKLTTVGAQGMATRPISMRPKL